MAETNPELRDEIRRIVRDETAGREAREHPPAAPVGDPAPLGLAAFALTTFILSIINAGWLAQAGTFIPLAFFYGGTVQILAGMWEFRNNNTFGSTAFCSYGAFWVALAFFFFEGKSLGVTGAGEGPALGFTLMAWALFTGYMMIGSLRTNMALITVFVLLFITYVVLTIAEILGVSGLGVLGGYLGIATALAAWYTSAAGVINSVSGKTVLPVGPRE